MSDAATTIQGSHEPKGLGTKLAPLLSGGFFRPLARPTAAIYVDCATSLCEAADEGAQVGHGHTCAVERLSSEHCVWLGDCGAPVRQLFAAGHRLAQKHVGWEFLPNSPSPDLSSP
ncbi:MAG: hypothetical protein WCS94_03110 [Verrucomicrobiota bacterium]